MMQSALRFLTAARQGEVAELEQFASAIELTRLIGQLVHGLQSERGSSNVFVVSAGTLFAQQRVGIIANTDQAITAVRRFFDQLDPHTSFASSSRARLFNRIAYALHGLQSLHDLRAQVLAQRLPSNEIIQAYSQLIARLLAVVFEAADSATDADISRQLVAYFSFIEAKEWAGQERAWGVVLLGSAAPPEDVRLQLLNVVDAQALSLHTFMGFCEPAVLSFWHAQEVSAAFAEVLRMRNALAGADSQVSSPSSVQWFEACSLRIDGMKQIEDRLTAQLQQLSADKILLAQQRHADCQAQLMQLQLPDVSDSAQPSRTANMSQLFVDGLTSSAAAASMASQAYGPHLERATLEMLQEQALRLQAVSDELDKAKAALHERKTIDRAKGLLMQHRQVSEEAAYTMMRTMAMEQNRRLIDVAKSVLALESYLGR